MSSSSLMDLACHLCLDRRRYIYVCNICFKHVCGYCSFALYVENYMLKDTDMDQWIRKTYHPVHVGHRLVCRNCFSGDL